MKTAVNFSLLLVTLSFAAFSAPAEAKPVIRSVSTTQLIAKDPFHKLTLNGTELINSVTTGFNLNEQVQVYARWFREWSPSSPTTDWRRAPITSWNSAELSVEIPAELTQEAGFLQVKVAVKQLGESDAYAVTMLPPPVDGPRFKKDPVLTLAQANPPVSGGNMFVTVDATGMTSNVKFSVSSYGYLPFGRIEAYRDTALFHFPSVALNNRGALPAWLETEYGRSPQGQIWIMGKPQLLSQSHTHLMLKAEGTGGVAVDFTFDDFTIPTQVSMSIGGGAFQAVAFNRLSTSKISVQLTPAQFAGVSNPAVNFSFNNVAGQINGGMTVQVISGVTPIPMPKPIPTLIPMPKPIPMPPKPIKPIPIPPMPRP